MIFNFKRRIMTAKYLLPFSIDIKPGREVLLAKLHRQWKPNVTKSDNGDSRVS